MGKSTASPGEGRGAKVQREIPVPNSPIAGGDDGFGVPSDTHKEVRRARFVAEVIYICDEGQFVDIEARVRDALNELGPMQQPDLGTVLVGLDLTEHVTLVAPPPGEPLT